MLVTNKPTKWWIHDRKYTSIIYVNCSWRNKNRSNPHSYEYYLTSSEIRAWKNSGPYEIWTHDLCNTNTTVFFFFIIIIICTFLWRIIDKPSIKSIATSPKWFTSPATSFPCTLSVFSDSFWPFKKKLLDGKRYWESEKSALPKNTAK